MKSLRSYLLIGLWALLSRLQTASSKNLTAQELDAIHAELGEGKAAPTFLSHILPSQMLSKFNLSFYPLADSDEERVGRLHAKLKETTALTDIKREEVEDMVRFIEHVLEVSEDWLVDGKPLYVNKEEGYLRFPVQFYANGRVYIHLLEHDGCARSGGFKEFSRSIEYHTQALVAHLVFPITSQSDAGLALHEIEILNYLGDNPAIINCYNAAVHWTWRNQVFLPELCYEAELYDCDLRHFLTAHASSLTWHDALTLAEEMARAVQSMHHDCILHRDIKPDNILVKSGSHGQLKLALADFGLAETASRDCGAGHRGTTGYIAPELCLGTARSDRPFCGAAAGQQADVYALGVSFLALIGEDNEELARRIVALNRRVSSTTADAAEEAYGLLSKCYALEVSRLPSQAMPLSLRSEFSRLILSMLSMEPETRPSLDKVIARLGELKGQGNTRH